VIISYSGAEVVLAMENLIEKSVSEISQLFLPEVFCQFEGKRIVLINKSFSKYLNVRNSGERDFYLEKREKRSIVQKATGNKAY